MLDKNVSTNADILKMPISGDIYIGQPLVEILASDSFNW